MQTRTRVIPANMYVDECEINKDECVWITHKSGVPAFVEYYTSRMIQHYNAVEFETLDDLKDLYEKSTD